MPNKTIQEYQQEIEQLRKAANLPGVPNDERAIYFETIQRIEAKIIELHRVAPASTVTPASQQPQKAASPQPIPVRVIKAGVTPRRQSKTAAASSSGTAETRQPATVACISGVIVADRKTVVIDWGHGRTDTLTEGEARGRFTTALRDLSESRMARRGRLDDIRQYVTFDRAVAYYRALTEFWLSAPSPQQLSIWPLSRLKAEIFEMVKTASSHEQQH